MSSSEALYFLEREGARPPQREAVTAPEPLVVVSAGAGTGKTRTLAWRFAWLVATGKAEFGEILTLTFTEKAALEMRQRIGATLRDWSQHCPENLAPARERLAEGAARIEEARISTIHSFASALVREAGFALDFPGGGRLVSAPEEQKFWGAFARALDFLDAEWFARLLGPEEPVAFLEEGRTMDVLNRFGPGEVASWCKALGDLWKSRGREWSELEDLARDPGKSFEALLFRELSQKYCSRWWEEGRTICDLLRQVPPSGKSNATTTAISTFLAAWAYAPFDSAEAPRFFLEILDLFFNRRGTDWDAFSELFLEHFGQKPADWRREKEKEERILAEVLRNPALGEPDQELRKELLRIGLLGVSCWESFRAREGLLTFDDLIALGERSIQATALGGTGFKAVLVDEFQDTDPLQDRLIQGVVAKNRENHGVSLFLVGDVKQSIYRFRHAEPRIFASYVKKAKKESAGRYVQLNESFRSRGDVLNHINRFFGHLWKEGLGEQLALGYEALRTPEKEDGTPLLEEREKAPDLPPVTHIVEPGTADEKGKLLSLPERRLLLARQLGEQLRSFCGSIIWDKENRCSRPCVFGDMAVLVPSRTSYGALEKSFGELEIPLVTEKNQEYFSRGEVLDATAWLNALATPKNNLALGGFLSSPFSPLSLEEVRDLLEALSREKNTSLVQLLERDFPETARWFEQERRRAFLEGPRKALLRLLRRPEAFKALSPYLRKRGVVNLRLAAALAGEYEASFGPDLLGCAAWLEKNARGRNVRQEEAQPWGAGENAVRVMTIHAAKGLEFPLVALFGLEQDMRGKSSSSLRADDIFGAVPSGYPEPWQIEGDPCSKALSGLFQRQALEEERQRLFYVACTRAQDALVFSILPRKVEDGGKLEFSSGSYLSWYVSWAFPEGLGLENALCAGKTELEERGAGEREKLQKREAESRGVPGGPLRLPLPGGGGLEGLNATSWALMRYCPRAWRLRYRQGRELFWNLEGDCSGEPGGADLGSLVHWVLRRWNFCPGELSRYLGLPGEVRIPSGLPLEYRRVYREERSRKAAREWLLAFAASERGQELKVFGQSKELRRESSFRVQIPQGPKVIGTVDAWAETEGKVRIWDYKIGSLERVPREIYEEQLRFYGWALHRAFPEHEVEMELLMLAEGEVLSVSPPASWEEMTEAFCRGAERGESGPFEGRKERCPSCPWRGAFCPGEEG